jgi:hypothetical protein
MRLKYSFILLQSDCVCEIPDSSVSIMAWLGVGRLEDRNSILGKENFSVLHGVKTGTGGSVPVRVWQSHRSHPSSSIT